MTSFITEKNLSLNDFAAICEQPADSADYPLADSIDNGVLIYSAAKLTAAPKDQVLNELNRVLSDGPGVFVVKQLYTDHALLERHNQLFAEIIKSESAKKTHSDHFAKAGSNGRIWNAFQKIAEKDPDAFIRYYANPLLSLICQAWLGTGYQITAQVNQVPPGGRAQQPHRDYHLGFQENNVAAGFPINAHLLSASLTLQGAIAHTDMPLASGPTLLLPYSHQYPAGYLAWRNQDFIDYFAKHRVQLPLKQGDGLFFNPALFHGAGDNDTKSHLRIANLLQISSAFGKAMETINHAKILNRIYPHIANAHLNDTQTAALIAAAAEGYSFPTNLDNDPPVSGMAPQTQQQILADALRNQLSPEEFAQALEENRGKRAA